MAYRCSSPPEGALWLEPVLSRRSAPLCGASALRRAVPWEEMLAGELLRLGALGRCLKLGSCLPLMLLKLFFPSKNNLNHLNIYLFFIILFIYIYLSKTYFKPNMAFTVLRAKGCIIFLLQGWDCIIATFPCWNRLVRHGWNVSAPGLEIPRYPLKRKPWRAEDGDCVKALLSRLGPWCCEGWKLPAVRNKMRNSWVTPVLCRLIMRNPVRTSFW